MTRSGVCECLGRKIASPDSAPWQSGEIVPLSVMWSEMMFAMMLPSVTPMVLMFAAVNRKRHESDRPYVPAGIFVAGYFIDWIVFSVLISVAQWALHSTALLSPAMASTNSWLGGSLLIAAGIFQWSPLKNACLVHCRSPLGFLMTDWKEGRVGALKMGLKHGYYCIGCCWILMALLFVAGVMNLWWVGVLSILVLVEKTAPNGSWVGRAIGGFLILWGVALLI